VRPIGQGFLHEIGKNMVAQQLGFKDFIFHVLFPIRFLL
jgi:hypothetical protein